MPPSALSLLTLTLAAVHAESRRYAVIFDAGSTGTRVHVYSYVPTEGSLPAIRAEPGGNMKVKPGLSAFDQSPAAAGDSIKPLVKLAAEIVPRVEHACTLVMLRATAGMRLLPKRRAQWIYDSVMAAISVGSGFRPQPKHFGTLSGVDEGVFGWLSVNQLLSHDPSRSAPPPFGSVGALDLGGGSTQITMAVTEGSSSVATVPLPGRSSAQSVFTHSHLGFGNKQVLGALSPAEAAACLTRGATALWEPGNNSLHRGGGGRELEGTGSFRRCEEGVRRVLASFEPHGQPRPRAGSRFVAMSLFFYSIHFARLANHLGAGPTVSPGALLAAAKGLCAEPDNSLRRMVGKDPLTPDDAIRWRCFDLT